MSTYSYETDIEKLSTMTSKQLIDQIEREYVSIKFMEAAITDARLRIVIAHKCLRKPMRLIEGGGKTKPRKKICRVHEWDLENNTRIRGHKHDHRHPSYKGKT